MDDDLYNLRPIKSLWQRVRAGLRRAHENRPASFYLLLSIPVVLILAVKLAQARDNPRSFFLFLALLFTFFIVIIIRALIDFIEITRKNMVEQKRIFRATIGEDEFLASLKTKDDDDENE